MWDGLDHMMIDHRRFVIIPFHSTPAIARDVSCLYEDTEKFDTGAIILDLQELCKKTLITQTWTFTILADWLLSSDLHNDLVYGWSWRWLMLCYRFFKRLERSTLEYNVFYSVKSRREWRRHFRNSLLLTTFCPRLGAPCSRHDQDRPVYVVRH